MAPRYTAAFFNVHIRRALILLEERNGYGCADVRQSCVDEAAAHIGHALRLANQMQDSARKAMCLRVMNWLRADMRRAA